MNNNFPVYYEIEFYDEDRKEYKEGGFLFAKDFVEAAKEIQAFYGIDEIINLYVEMWDNMEMIFPRERKLIVKCLTKLIIILVVCGALGIVADSIYPILLNNVAMGQLENDNLYFVIVNEWDAIVRIIAIFQSIIAGIGLYYISKDVYNYFNRKREN